MYIVEIWHEGDALAEPMTQIRTRLDHEHIQPSVFRFNIVCEAEAVAHAFAGQVIEDERAGAVTA